MSNLFLNLSLENTTDEIIPAKINPITRLENIFNNDENTKDYNLSVNRFALPSGLIELLFLNEDYYIETKIKDLLYFNSNMTDRETEVYDLIQRTYLDTSEKIYSYEQFVEIFNRALFENYYKLSRELLRSKYSSNSVFQSKTLIQATQTTGSASHVLFDDSPSVYSVDEFTHTFPESDVTKLIGIEFKLKRVGVPRYKNTIKCIIKSPTNQEFCIFHNSMSEDLLNSNIIFNEYSKNVIQNQELDSSITEARFRESSLDILNDNPTGDWTIRFEFLRVGDGSETNGLRHFDYDIEFIFPVKPNVKRDANYLLREQSEIPNSPMYLGFYNDTSMDYFQLNYHQDFNRLGIQLGLSPKLNYIVEFNNFKENDIHYIQFPKNLYTESTDENPIIKYKQEFNSVFKICHASLIEFRTTQIPIEKELQTKSGVSSSILTDFEIPVSSMNQNGMFYFNSQQKRLS